MQLVQLPISLSSFKVRLALALAGVEIELIEPEGGSYRSQRYRELVPPATIPALITPDGVLTETDSIIEYLDETRAATRLMQGTALRRARIRMLSRLVDLRLEAALRALFAHVAPATRDAAEVGRARERISAALDVIEWALDPAGPFANDDRPSMADCGIAATGAWLEALQPHLLAGLVTGSRWQRVRRALRGHPMTGPQITTYSASVAGWVDDRLRR